MLCFGFFAWWCVFVVVVLVLSLVFGFSRWFWGTFCFAAFSFLLAVVWGLEGEFVVAFVRLVDDLVQVFCGELLLGVGGCVCACVAEVVCGTICCVDHVCLFV